MQSKLAKTIKSNRVIQAIYRFCFSLLFNVCGVFVRTKKNLVLCSAMSGDSYEGSSPKLIADSIEQKYPGKYEFIWAFTHPEKIEIATGKKVKMHSFSYFMSCKKAGIWITDVNIERGLRIKRKKTYYVNTWHGTVTKGFPKNAKYVDFSNVSLFCVDGEPMAKVFEKYYRVPRESMLFCGRPREDRLFSAPSEERAELRRKYGFSENDYILLYMPTFRDVGKAPTIDADALVTACGPDAKFLFHSHHFSGDETVIGADKNPRIVNLSEVRDVNDLYLMADMLVSDFSTSIFDFLLTKRPVVLFAPDYDFYCSQRGLLYDFKANFPGGINTTTEGMIERAKSLRADPETEIFQTALAKHVNRPANSIGAILEKMEKDGAIS